MFFFRILRLSYCGDGVHILEESRRSWSTLMKVRHGAESAVRDVYEAWLEIPNPPVMGDYMSCAFGMLWPQIVVCMQKPCSDARRNGRQGRQGGMAPPGTRAREELGVRQWGYTSCWNNGPESQPTRVTTHAGGLIDGEGGFGREGLGGRSDTRKKRYWESSYLEIDSRAMRRSDSYDDNGGLTTSEQGSNFSEEMKSGRGASCGGEEMGKKFQAEESRRKIFPSKEVVTQR